MEPAAIDKRLLNEFQRDFPLDSRPYARIAATLGVSEEDVLAGLAGLRDQGMVSRVGAVVRPNTVGASTLAAMAVPPELLDHAAAIVNDEPGVNHNYEREHAINLWFVVTAADADGVAETIQRIERKTGIPVLDLRLEQAYHIDLGFDLK
jgi:DNA-binding Lrp family transcriptional regulator